ncbi:MAG: toxin-antitoxin system YwqK family antitoxin [Elusimicrobiales bacterium]
MFLIFLMLIFTNYFHSEEIHLRDGTVIFGDFEGEMDNYYVVRTKYGVLSIPKDDILKKSEELRIPDNVNLRIEIKKSSEGYVKNFYEGSVLSASQFFSNDGVMISSSGLISDGIYYEYDSDGNLLSERTIRNGFENGPLIEFYPNGGVKARIDFKDGKINGKAIYYSDESRPILEQTYTNGLLDGFSIEYDADGNIKTKVLYSSGKMVDSIVKKADAEMMPISPSTPSAISQEHYEKKEDNKKADIKSNITTKVLNIARGKKVFVNFNSKYTGSFIYDSSFNIVDITGKIPDGSIIVEDSKLKLTFEFLSNWPVSLIVLDGGVEVKRFMYDDNGKASEIR